MQTIGKYVAAFILVLASSYFNPSGEHDHTEKEVEVRSELIKTSPCMADAITKVRDSLS